VRKCARIGGWFPLACLLVTWAGPAAADIPPQPLPIPPPAPVEFDFPRPESLESAVVFWKRVYLEATTRAGLLHDSRHLAVVYEALRFDDEHSERARQRRVKARKSHWRSLLRRLSGGHAPRNVEEETVLRLWERALGRRPEPRDFAQAGRRVRFQLGQRDKFRDGIIRSGAYEEAMRAVFRDRGLPEDLAYLPHVESSFNLNAYSKYGAAGVWQFMRSTGRRYMTVDYVIDERLDPMASTRAATRLLSENHAALGSWPLAITAYNHGRSGVARAKRKLGTADIGVIAERYRSRKFGFASRNFYAQFLAAREIMRNWPSFFGPLQRDEPEPVDEVTLPFFADLADLRKHLGVSPEVIRHYNRALRPPVFRGTKRIPKGFVLRLPAGTVAPDLVRWLARVPREDRHTGQLRSHYYQVRRGDTLSGIAARNGTSVHALVVRNNLPSRHRIYPGQVLELPGASAPARPRTPSLVARAEAAPKPRPPAPKAPAAAVSPTRGKPPPLPEDSPWRRVDGDHVLVDAGETLGHYAEWLELPTGRLRQLNRLRPGRPLRIGQRIRLDFKRVPTETFLERRIEYHKGIEEDFFGTYRVTGTVEHRLESGDTLWVLSRSNGVPIWLIQRYNAHLDLRRPMPGTLLRIPVAEPLEGS
jgi:membrane-bound lytic murein transglycosylase D